MTSLGNFFFRNRNGLFLFLYLPVLLPSPRLFRPEVFGAFYYVWPVVLGLAFIVIGEVLRRYTTVSHEVVLRGNRIKATELEIGGLFHHSRNPLYVSQLTTLFGLGILSNSIFYLVMIFPYAFFLYFAIVWAEEAFMWEKFGKKFEIYCEKVPRWKFNPEGLLDTLRQTPLNYRAWFIKEYKALGMWALGLASLIMYKYPELLPDLNRLWLLALMVAIMAIGYVRHLTQALRLRKRIA